jgi:hypothetical protein
VAPAAKEKNDIEFSKKLSENIDIFVLDAFGTAHRAHALTTGIADYMSSRLAGLLLEKELEYLAGLLLEKELEYLAGVVKNPTKPFVAIVAIVGGSKISSKITVIKVGAALVHLSALVPGIKAGRAELVHKVVVSLLLGTLLKREVNPAKQPTLYLHPAFTATFFMSKFREDDKSELVKSLVELAT